MRRVFPGDRRVWLAAGAVAVLGVAAWLFAMLQPREVFAGSNSVGARDVIAIVPAGEELCVPRLRIPAGTGRVRLGVSTETTPRPALDFTLRAAGQHFSGSVLGGRQSSLVYLDLPLGGTLSAPDGRDHVLGELCVTPREHPLLVWGVSQRGIADLPLRLGGEDVNARVALWYLPAAASERSYLGRLGAIFDRAELFRPAFVGPWTFWLVLFGALPLLGYAAVRLLATAEQPPRRRRSHGGSGRSSRHRRLPLGLAVALVAFGHAASWALVTPAYQSPDESEHFAAVQYLAETGNAVATPETKDRVPWSSEQAVAIDATRLLSSFERDNVNLPWLKVYEDAWRERDAPGGRPLPQDNGGGPHPVTQSHSPLYYSLLVPAYAATQERSPYTQLLATRLTSALMGALVALFAFLIVAELLPGRRALAAGAGLLVGLQPMFGFISGSVNNDNGVNLAAAALIWLVVRLLRRGPSWPEALALGAVVAVTPIFKGTGYELYPPFAMALAFMLVRHHRREHLLAYGAMAAGFAAVYLGWDVARTAFERPAFTTPEGLTPGSFAALENPRAFGSWLWQWLIPLKPAFMTDFTVVKWPFYNIYVQRGFGSYGWYAIEFPHWVYGVVVATMAAGVALAGAAVWRFRAAARVRWAELLFLASLPVAVFLAVEAAYFTLNIPLDGVAEQGRYAFPAITACSAIAIGGCVGLGRGRAVPAAAVLVSGLAVLAWAGQWLTLMTFYA